MLWRNLWLKVPLLLPVAGQAMLLERLTGRAEPGWQVGLVAVIAALVVPLLGEWLAEEASSLRWRKVGWRVAAAGAGLHLALDAGCLALPWLDVPGWPAAVAGALVGAAIMAVLLRGYLAALADPEGLPPPAWRPSGDGPLARLWAQAALVGGDAILVTAIGLGFVVAVVAILVARPDERGDARPWLTMLFFGLVAVVGAVTGAQRRAAALGLPSPVAGLWPRWLRRSAWVVTREGLLLVARREARLYRWDDVVAAGGGEIAHNPAVLVLLTDGAAPVWLAGDPSPRQVAAEARNRAFQRGLQGCDLALLGVHTERGPGPLLAELALALGEPSSRAALPWAAAELERIRGEL